MDLFSVFDQVEAERLSAEKAEIAKEDSDPSHQKRIAEHAAELEASMGETDFDALYSADGEDEEVPDEEEES